MGRDRWLLFGILACLILFFSTFRDRFVTTSTSLKPSVKTLKIIEDRIKEGSQKKTTNAISENQSISNLPDGEVSKEMVNCWERIRDEYQMTPDYIDINRHQMNQVVGEWFYSKHLVLENIYESSAVPLFC